MCMFPGSTSRKVGWGSAAYFPKSSPYLWPKSAFFATPFMTCPKIRLLIYDRYGWPSCPKHKLWRAFVDGFIGKDEVASSEKHTQFKTRVLKPYRVGNQNGQNRYPVYDQNSCKTPFFTAEHSHIAHKGSNPSPGCVWCIFIQSKTNLQFITVRQDSSRVCDLKLLFYRKHTEDVMLVVFSQLINGRKLNVWWRKRRGTIPFNWNANFILTDKQEVI